ncbi:Acyl-CoA synthetase (AMP-forming)/AMP-acid ligase II [Actinokineospora alba]|uniref:Acyl-CoA synthetase (AMP-forming)/AMP-acid ligase II n=1 Tax=Actinokineospora alba TaxID=504798 RepID=A0A1H0HBL7_9PSEU|nr:AMP-binding protein [Actinokineospora alba]TDP64950.1 acyl-CoA synthetase (AMP-forming)/AMP-acid ligase II [Actinokineospora alba]SDH50101.1 Acyl-CoA synthetase (AMP-forming)/AMP-acid ligase II [Actinokineospora alba]SDO16555.1 Acyl-CoA synthetase (AMP-forming)/AMP-acid ligase II [Actinokineospora alba]
METRSLLDRIAEQATTRPDAVALVSGSRQVDYAELDAMADAALARIDALDLAEGAPVAVHAAKSPETVALILACLRGRRPVLVAAADLGERTYAELVARTGCAAVLTADPAGPVVRRTDGAPAAKPDLAEETALLLTTSGSTGTPKIVPLTHGAIARFARWAADQFDLGPDTDVLNYAPLNFDLALLDVWSTLAAGGTVVLVGTDRATDGRHLAEVVRRSAVVQAVPMLFRLLADAWDGTAFTAVRHVILTGDRTPAPLLARLPAMFPNARLHNIYGCTETNDSFRHELTTAAGDGEMPIGFPLPGVDALVLDADGAILTGECTGELVVHTPFQTTGYLASNGAEFVRLGTDERPYFRSGDLVRRDRDGLHTLVGRTDFRVKVRGTRVNLEEVEQVLLDHAQVREAAVIGVPDEVAGIRLHAVVRGGDSETGALNSLALREHCRLRLPRAAIPTSIQVVGIALPTTSTGKVDRRAIGARLLNRSQS